MASHTTNPSQNAVAADVAADGWRLIAPANGSADQARPLGITRQINTVKGERYSLNFEVAIGSGFSGNTARVAVFVDDAEVSVCDKTSPNWPNVNMDFIGSGGAQTIQIIAQAEGDAITANASSHPIETEASNAAKLTLTGMPVGSVLSDGNNCLSITALQQVADISGWNAGMLAITPPPGITGKITLLGTASATIRSNGSKARVSKTFNIEVEHRPNPYIVHAGANQLAGDAGDKLADKLAAGPLAPVNASRAIALPWVTPAEQGGEAGEISKDADVDMENWLEKLGQSVSGAFLGKVGKILGKK